MAPHSSVLAWRIPGTGEPVSHGMFLTVSGVDTALQMHGLWPWLILPELPHSLTLGSQQTKHMVLNQNALCTEKWDNYSEIYNIVTL